MSDHLRSQPWACHFLHAPSDPCDRDLRSYQDQSCDRDQDVFARRNVREGEVQGAREIHTVDCEPVAGDRLKRWTRPEVALKRAAATEDMSRRCSPEQRGGRATVVAEDVDVEVKLVRQALYETASNRRPCRRARLSPTHYFRARRTGPGSGPPCAPRYICYPCTTRSSSPTSLPLQH